MTNPPLGTDDASFYCDACRRSGGPCPVHDIRGPLGELGEPGSPDPSSPTRGGEKT